MEKFITAALCGITIVIAQRKKRLFSLLMFTLCFFHPSSLLAQDDMKVEAYDTTHQEEENKYKNETGGEFTPGRGFDVFKSKMASLNISIYGLIRFTNQLPDSQTFTDHLGRIRPVDTRRDLQWHRTFIWLSGHFFTPRLRYVISIWGLASTGQSLVFGNMQYQVHRALRIGAGIGPNLGVRSLQGPWPYFLSTDRVMSEEALRPGFTGGFWLTGEPFKGFNYWLMMGNNLSTLGINNTQNTRDLSTSASVWWMPTTKEFGPRGGSGDIEYHEKLATRFGASVNHAREDRFTDINVSSPAETQVRLSDGVLFFETGALGDSITVKRADYDFMSFDAGFKYKGFNLQTEFIRRKLSKFDVNKSLSLTEIVDKCYYVTLSYAFMKRKLNAYAIYSKMDDQFNRDPWELSGGLSYYPSGTRSWRLNLHVIHVDKSPTGSSFGMYVAGQTGTSIFFATDIML